MNILNRLGLVESVETMVALERRMGQMSNNLANVNTTGFKKDDQSFGEILFRTEAGRMRVGKAIENLIDHSQGPLQQTGNTFDLAIGGEGFFKIETPAGPRYTRAGNFVLNDQGELSMANGAPVGGEGGPIIIAGEEVVISQDGRVVVDGVETGRIAVVRFAPDALEKEGDALLRLKVGAGPEAPAEAYEVHQGFLEGANLDPVKGMTEMIDVFRAFETQQRIVQAIDSLDDQAVSRVGSLNR